MNFNNLSLQIGNGLFASQGVDLFGGLFLLLIGAAIFYTLATWRLRGLQVDGEIIGVRRRGPYYHAVYRYVSTGSAYRQATSVQGNNSPHGLQTGRHVLIQVMAGKPDEARERNAPMLWALANALLLSGSWLIYVGVTVSKRSPMAWLLTLLALTFVAHWLWTRVKALLAKMQPVATPDPWSALPIEAAESLGASRTSTTQLSSIRSKSGRSAVIFVVLGLGFFALAFWQARGLRALGHGVRTAGIVMELIEAAPGTSGDSFLFPVVQYTGQDGSVVRFHDRTGARPSPFKIGDTVPVKYLPGNPATAQIDRGPYNWEPLGWLAVMGVMLTGLGIVAMRGQITGDQP